MAAISRWLRAPGRLAALLLLILAAGLFVASPYPLREVRVRGFDAMQRLSPQPPPALPVVIVDIDEESLQKLGQWPWPRTLVARLIERIAAGHPAVLGIDILFPEPDRLSPPQLSRFLTDLPTAIAAQLADLPANETRLAQAIASVPTVLAMAPSDEDVAALAKGKHRAAPLLQKGGPPDRFVISHRSMIRSLPEIASAARAEASIGVEIDEDGVVRRVPLLERVEGQLVPSFAVEILRLATRNAAAVVTTGEHGITDVSIGDLAIPVDQRGRAYLHFEPPTGRYISADDLLADGFDVDQLRGRIILLGVSGLGTVDQKNAPLGLMLGTEVHAQLIESILAGTLLHRPAASFWIEFAVLVVAGIIVIALLPYDQPLVATVGIAAIVIVLLGAEFTLFRFAGWLIDTIYETAAAILVFGTMVGGNFITAQRELQVQREVTARLEGEMTAARAIQMGLLPLHFPAFPEHRELDLYARIEPARDVGGDLFDFLLIDRTHLFFMIGDVSGKGIPAALFMAMTKEVVRGAAAQHGAALDRLLAMANGKIGDASNHLAEDGADMMFVTALAGALDLTTGDLVYASAGHDSPLVIRQGQELRVLATEGGPPLGVVEDFPYPVSRDRLEPDAVLLLYTDGVTEAQNAAGTLYGSARLENCFEAAIASSSDARATVDLVFNDIVRFVNGAEQFDDITLLALRRISAAS